MARTKKDEVASKASTAPAPTLTVGTELLRAEPPALGVVQTIEGDRVTLLLAEGGGEIVVGLDAIDVGAGSWSDAPIPPIDSQVEEAPPSKPVDLVTADVPREDPPQGVGKVDAEPSVAIPDTHELAMWVGLGRFSGVLYTYPDGKERPFCVGPTLGYFPKTSVGKLKGQFERHRPSSEGTSAPAAPKLSAGHVPVEGHVLARWTGLGRFSGRFYSFPAREERMYCVGPTVGFFDEASVKKLAGHFEKL